MMDDDLYGPLDDMTAENDTTASKMAAELL